MTLTNDDDADGVCRIVELDRGEVVDDGPGGQHGDDADGGAGDPPALVIIPLDPEHGHPVEEGQDQQEDRVDVQQEEGLLGHITLGVELARLDLERHVDDEPLGGDHHLDHHHEEQGQELIYLKIKQLFVGDLFENGTQGSSFFTF